MLITFPNFLTFFRFIFVGMAYFFGKNDQWLLVLVMAGVAAISDFLDGYFARKLDCKSTYGAIADPIADKFFVVILLSLINVHLATIILVLEFVGSGFSNIVRKSHEGHFVANGSKGVTFFQMLVVIIFISNKIFNLDYIDNYQQGAFGFLIALSLCRLLIYGSAYRDIRKGKSKK